MGEIEFGLGRRSFFFLRTRQKLPTEKKSHKKTSESELAQKMFGTLRTSGLRTDLVGFPGQQVAR
jgi:hypothetical protein